MALFFCLIVKCWGTSVKTAITGRRKRMERMFKRPMKNWKLGSIHYYAKVFIDNWIFTYYLLISTRGAYVTLPRDYCHIWWFIHPKGTHFTVLWQAQEHNFQHVVHLSMTILCYFWAAYDHFVITQTCAHISLICDFMIP